VCSRKTIRLELRSRLSHARPSRISLAVRITYANKNTNISDSYFFYGVLFVRKVVRLRAVNVSKGNESRNARRSTGFFVGDVLFLKFVSSASLNGTDRLSDTSGGRALAKTFCDPEKIGPDRRSRSF